MQLTESKTNICFIQCCSHTIEHMRIERFPHASNRFMTSGSAICLLSSSSSSAAVMSRCAPAFCLQVILSCPVLCQIVSLRYLSKSSLRPLLRFSLNSIVYKYISSQRGLPTFKTEHLFCKVCLLKHTYLDPKSRSFGNGW